MKLTSSAFNNSGRIPVKYTCDGENVSPPLTFEDIPENAASLVLIMDDPDVPTAVRPERNFDHWVLFNIPPETREIAEGASAGTPGVNGAGESAYTGPCPPPQYEPKEHRYFFRLYALDTELSLSEGTTKAAVLEAIKSHILKEAELMGTYSRE